MGILHNLKLTLVAALVMLSLSNQGSAAITGLQRVASGLSSPMFVTHAPGDRDRLFIAERGGTIRILNLKTGAMEPTPFLTMTGISTTGEGGFLGMAFHPNYFNEGTPGFGKFYVSITTNSTTISRIREFEVSESNPNVAPISSLREVLSFSQPQANHNGGWIGFSPVDNYLYIASGDGGGSNDPNNNAQNITSNLLGKMLRIDVDGDDFPADATRNYAIPPTNPFAGPTTGLDEIWSYGMRNPFRASFDRITGDLWIGDVGQGAREEIDFQPASSTGGENYGWRLREGSIQTPSVGGPCPTCIEPVYDYRRPGTDPVNDPNNLYKGTVVSGGYVYRGPDPSLQGKYFFLDSRNNTNTAQDNYWHFDPANPYGTVLNINHLLTKDVGTGVWPVSFGEDAVGNLYIAYLVSGEVYRIATNQLLAGDFDADGDVNMNDYETWLAAYGSALPHPAAAVPGNSLADAANYVLWRANLGNIVHALGAGSQAVPEPLTATYLVQFLVLMAVARQRWR